MKVSSTRRDRAALLFCTLRSAVGISLDPPCLLGICRVVMWCFILGNHQDLAKYGTRVIGETWT
jgi:hypothetical protein